MQFYDNCTIDGIELEEDDIINRRRELLTVPTTSIAEQEPMDVIRRTAEKVQIHINSVESDVDESDYDDETVSINPILICLENTPDVFDNFDCVQYQSMRIDEIARTDELLRIVVTDLSEGHQMVFTQNEDNFTESNRRTVEPLEAFRQHFGLTIFATTDDN
jgi:hypothetical protein